MEKDLNKELVYATEVRKARRKGSGGTQEFFTPDSLVSRMCDKVSDDDWADPRKTFLEPSAGNGNFVVEIVRRRIGAGIDWRTVLKTIYTVELMADNVVEMKKRVYDLLVELGTDVDYKQAYKIMNKNFVCSDFFKWDFENWKPIHEIKELELNFD